MPHESPVFQQILSKMPKDFDWDESVPMEKIYKECEPPVARYFLGGVRSFTEHGHTQETKESVLKHSEARSCAGAKLGLDSGASSCFGLGATVKIENIQFLEFEQVCGVLKSAKVVLERLSTQAGDVCSKLNFKMRTDNSLTKRSSDFTALTGRLTGFLGDLRDFLAAADFADPADSSLPTQTEEANKLKEKCLIHESGMKAQLKELKALF